MQIIVVAIVLVALIAWIVVKNDEMSGLGRNVKAGTLRHPHGKLVRAKATTVIPEEAPLANRIKRSMPFISSVAIIAVCVGFHGIGPFELAAPRHAFLDRHRCVDHCSRSDIARARGRSYVLVVCLCPRCGGSMRPRCVGVHCNGRFLVV